MVRVLLVEDHPATRIGIRRVLSELEEGTEVVGETGSAGEAAELARTLGPDLVILDLDLEEKHAGVETCQRIESLSGAPRVLVYTGHNSPEDIAYSWLCGADSYVHKSEDAGKLLEAVRSASAGRQSWFLGVKSEKEAEARLRAARSFADLTEREQEVFGMLAESRTNREIARELGVGQETVKTHVANILAKLELASRREVASMRGRRT